MSAYERRPQGAPSESPAKKTVSKLPQGSDTPVVSRAGGGPRRSRAALAPHHRTQLLQSGISEEVLRTRGYQSLGRTNTDSTARERLKNAGFAAGVHDDERRLPGLLIPVYGPSGRLSSYQYRPDRPRKDDRGRPRKYEAPRGRSSVLDVHPLNASAIVDPTRRLWVTEGVKKADALTSAGECVVALSGVFNWRGRHGVLGEWEEVFLRGREVVVCFDSDARSNPNVAAAMARLGTWLRSRGARVLYVVTPEVGGLGAKTGVDDFLAAGGSIAELMSAALAQPPDPAAADDSLSDSHLAEQLAHTVLAERFCYVRGLGWLEYDGLIWRESGEERVVEETRLFLRDLLRDATDQGASVATLKALAALQSGSRIAAIARLTRGMDSIQAHPSDFDADPWLLNAANGVVDLRTGELLDHSPAFLMRHSTGVAYRPEAAHPDWERALEALPDAETAAWTQCYLGTGATGLTPREDVATFWHGGGSNGKSTLLGAAQAALGTYAKALLPTMLGGRRDEHPTEYMDLLGTRLAFVEETGDGHRLDTVKLKKFQGTETITGRRMRQDPVEFRATHTLVVTTNYRPVVTDTDHGTWRRLRMVPFPKTFGQGGRSVDRGLRSRLMNQSAQQEAVLAWLVRGAAMWHESGLQLPDEPQSVAEATRTWRESTDLIYSFVRERVQAAPGGIVEVEHLRQEFNDWLPSPHQPWGRQTFAERFDQHEAMRELGAQRCLHPRNRRAAFKGVRLKLHD